MCQELIYVLPIYIFFHNDFKRKVLLLCHFIDEQTGLRKLCAVPKNTQIKVMPKSEHEYSNFRTHTLNSNFI